MDNMKSLEFGNKALILLTKAVREWRLGLQEHLKCDVGNQKTKGTTEKKASKYA